MDKKIIVLLVIAAVSAGAFFLFKGDQVPVVNTDSEVQYYEDGSPIVYCDGAGNRYATVAEAKAAGLSAAEFGATYCQNEAVVVGTDYTGLSVAEATALAETKGESFRVVEIDGVAQPTTADFQAGRINASVNADVVSTFTIESNNDPVLENTDTTAKNHDDIIGLTITGAGEYAKASGVDFRVGTNEGEVMALTADFRQGRITADIVNGVVTSYTVEQ